MKIHQLLLLALCLALSSCASLMPKRMKTAEKALAPQEFTWNEKRAPSGPVLVFVSIPRQEALVFRNGVRIGRASISTGREGHQTPSGVFQILQKDVDHHSSTYNNASMPFMERLTWDGVALHAGYNPGHPDSHGCVRLPLGFAKKLYSTTHLGGTVIISNENKTPSLALVEGFTSDHAFVGQGSASSSTSIIVSTSSRKLQVYQNGKLVANSSCAVDGKLSRFRGESIFLFARDNQWHRVEGKGEVASLKKDMVLPIGFGAKLNRLVHPGTTMIVTDEPLSPRGGRGRSILHAGN